MSALLTTSECEDKFLNYIAAQINWEVGRFQSAKQVEEEARARISALADLTLEILGSRNQVEAWLEAATKAREAPFTPSAGDNSALSWPSSGSSSFDRPRKR